MKNVLYTKYSTERSDKFKIVTSIIKNNDGSVYVEKRRACEKAQSHILSLYEKYIKLEEYYKTTVIEPIPCKIVDGSAVFPFVIGDSLENILDRYIEAGDYKGVLANIENYRKNITENVEIIPFKVSDNFIRVFGQNYPAEDVDAFRTSNIDLIFSNIIMSDSKWKMMDYEWTFDFPVPVEYIVYRAVKIYAELFSKRKVLIDNNIFSFLGIRDWERQIYDKMESSFQAYVLMEHIPMWKLYDSIGTKNIYLYDIIQENINSENRNEIQIFFDNGDGFSEENSYKIFKSYDEPVEIEIILEHGVKGVRIDPATDFCIVKVMDAVGNSEGFYDLNVLSNGIEIGDRCFVFPTQDPQMHLYQIKSNTDRIIVKLEIQILGRSFVYNICKAVNGLQAMIDDINRDAKSKENVIESVIMEKEAVLNSTSWKITRPYRIIATYIKRALSFLSPNK